MNTKVLAFLAASALTFGSLSANAGPLPSGFDQNAYATNVGGPKGFSNNAPKTVRDVLQYGYDDQRVVLQGRLTQYLGHDRYVFADETGQIRVELDDDRDWSHIAKDQLIRIYGKLDISRKHNRIEIEVRQAEPVR